MMRAGFLQEVESLHRVPGLTGRHTAIRSVGYRQLWAYFEREFDLPQALERAVAATRQMAKRQMTWLNGDRSIPRLNPASAADFIAWRDAVLAAC